MKKNIRLSRVLVLLVIGVMAVFAAGCSDKGGKDAPPALAAFDTGNIPMAIPGSDGGYGDIALDGNGDLLIPNTGTGEIHRLDRETCTLETVATLSIASGDTLISVVYDPNLGMIFAGTNYGNIFSVDPVTGTSTAVGNIGSAACGMAIAPEGFGSFGGRLVIGSNSGAVIAADPSAGLASSLIHSFSGEISDLVFGGDGTLYVANYGDGQVATLSAAGVSSVLASGLPGPDGIAFDGVGNRLLVADSSAYILYAVSVTDGTATPLRHVVFDSGWYPTGLAFDGVDTLLMASGEGSMTITAVTFPGFDTSTLPLDVTGATVGYGDIALDGHGDLLIPNLATSELMVLSRTTGALTTLASITSAGNLMSVVYDPTRDTIFVGATNGDIIAVDPATGASTLEGNIGHLPNAMAMAPAGFGSFEGHIVIAAANGGVIAADPSAGMATTDIASIPGYISDLVFTPAGKLYVVGGDAASVMTVTADGTVTDLATGFSGPDGIALDKGENALIVADSDTGDLYRVDIDSGSHTSLGTYAFDGGWYPSGLVFDGYRTVLMVTGSMTITGHQL